MMSGRRHLLFRVLLLVVAGSALWVVGWRLYLRAIECAKEETLRQDLFSLRQVISLYTLDKQHSPLSLDDLKRDGYIRDIPLDPFTGRADWVVDKAQELRDTPLPDAVPGIVGVHSASNAWGATGTAYSTW